MVDYKSQQAMRNSMANLSSMNSQAGGHFKQRIYSSGNPLRMIKEYQTNKSKPGMTGSMSFKSNASTKAFQNEEIQRLNMIMNEPIDHLIENMNSYSRPVSSTNPMS